MGNLGLVLLVFAFVCFCMAGWLWAPAVVCGYRLIAIGLAFFMAALIFGGLSSAHLLGHG